METQSDTKNPLDNIREESKLLQLFQSSTMSEIVKDIVNDISERRNEIKKEFQDNANRAYYTLEPRELNRLEEELNKQIKPRNLKCSIEDVSCKSFSISNKGRLPGQILPPVHSRKELSISNEEPMVGVLKFEPAFMCRKHMETFDTEEELKEHLKKTKHITIKIKIPKTEKQLTIIKNNTTSISVPLFELIEKSGALAEIKNRIKPFNLKCSIDKISGEQLKVLKFEPALRCNRCGRIFDIEHELNEDKKKHEEKDKKKHEEEDIDRYNRSRILEEEKEKKFEQRKKEREIIQRTLDKTR